VTALKRKVIAIIAAGGSGSRFKEQTREETTSRKTIKGTPKQFLILSGKPVILHSLGALQKCASVDAIIIAAGKERFDYLHKLAHKNGIRKLIWLVEGGATRFESVRNAFMQIAQSSELEKDDLVLIHDAARPNVNPRLFENIIDAGFKYGEVIIGSRVSETIKRVNKDYVKETLDRSSLWSIQTPQIFRYGTLLNSYQKAKRTEYTDESSLVEECGFKVRIIQGEKYNIKITSPADLQFLKKIVKGLRVFL